MGMQQQFDGDDARGDAAECGRVRQSAAETSVSVCMLSDALLRSRERGVEDSRIREGWRHPLKTELKSAKTKKRGFKQWVGSKNKKQYWWFSVFFTVLGGRQLLGFAKDGYISRYISA